MGAEIKLEILKPKDIFSLQRVKLHHTTMGIETMNILVLDGYNMIHRCRFNWGGGQAVGDNQIIYNFFRALRPLIDDESIDAAYFVTEGRPSHRLEIDPEYKANRVSDDLSEEEVSYWSSFHLQKEFIIDMLDRFFPITVVNHPEYEADDVIYHLAKIVHPDDSVKIVSSDTDFIQILNEYAGRVTLWNPVSKKYRENTSYDYVKWKAMVGDKADNISGISRIGKKTAEKILTTPGELDRRMEDLNFNLEFNKYYSLIKLADLSSEADSVSFSDNKVDWEYIRSSFNQLEFKFSFDDSAWEKYTSSFNHLNNDNLGE